MSPAPPLPHRAKLPPLCSSADPRSRTSIPGLRRDSNGDVVAWDVRTRRPRWRLPAHTPSSGALHVGIEPSSGHIMTQGRDGTLKCWGTAHGPHEPPRAPPRWTLNAGSYHYCKFTTSGGDASSPGAPALVAVAAEIQSGVDICEIKNSSIDDETSTLNAPPSRVATLIAAADATHADKTTTTSSESPPAATEDRLGTVMALAFIPNEDEDPSMLAAAYEEGTVCVWRIDSSTPMWRARVHGEAATCLAVDAVGKGFVSGGADGRCIRHRVIAADASDENSIKVSVIGTHGPFAPASVDAAGDVRALCGIAAVAIRDDRKIFAAGCWDGRVRVFEYGRGSAGRLVASLG